MGLAGLHWFVDQTQEPIFPFAIFFARPFPFVALSLNSNTFWLGLVCPGLVDFVLTVAFAVVSHFFWAAVFVFLFVLTLINLCAFMKCHTIVKGAMDQDARALLLDRASAQCRQCDDEEAHGECLPDAD
jgi:hypothetical protein